MAYNTIIGMESSNCPEWGSFNHGFNMPCKNGFLFSEVSGFAEYYL